MTAVVLGRLVAAVAVALAVAWPAIGALAGAARPAAVRGRGAGLRARAAAVAGQLAADTTTLQRLGTRYVAAEQAQRTAEAAARRLGREAAAVTVAMREDTLYLRRAAIDAYVSSGNTTTLGLALEQRPDELALSRAYLDAATSRLTAAATHLADDRIRLGHELAGQRHAATAAAAALVEIGRARKGALAAYEAENHLLSSLHGQLAQLVAEQAAARAAAARARLAAAERRAEQAAAARRAASSRAHGAPTSPSGSAPVRAVVAGTSTHADGGQAAGTATSSPPASPTTTTPSSPPSPAPPPPASSGPPVPTGTAAGPTPTGSIATDFAGIRNCESGDNYSLDTGNGYYGAYQFSLSTWLDLGESGLPSSAPPAVQDAAAFHLYQEVGWTAWPACSAVLGLG